MGKADWEGTPIIYPYCSKLKISTNRQKVISCERYEDVFRETVTRNTNPNDECSFNVETCIMIRRPSCSVLFRRQHITKQVLSEQAVH